MQINIGNYYRIIVGTDYKIIKVQQLDTQNIPYGTYSLSDFVNIKDGQGIQITESIVDRVATNNEATDWDTWYNQ
jgi:hypothetical protein